MPDIAARRVPDDSLALLRDGYVWALRRRARLGALGFTTRLMGRRALVVAGPEGVRLFYDERLRRQDALPKPLANTLFGKGAVHGLDDEQHRHRKAMFVHILTPEAAADIARRAADEWRTALERWAPGTRLPVFDTAVGVHARAVCAWAGVPADRVDDRVAADLIAMVDGFGGVGVRHLRARAARRRSDRWASALIRAHRAGDLEAPDGSALAVIAAHRDLDGALLSDSVAAVELLNLLRPTTAVSYFVAFALDALRSMSDPPTSAAELEAFAHEVRRGYPFVPVLGALARTDFTWHGTTVSAGTLVVLDVYGTMHDEQWWPEPDEFRIDRFANGPPTDDRFVPQGGGDVPTGHRCPGERVAIELIKTAVIAFAGYAYDVPAQDLSIALSRMPTKPHDGMLARRLAERP